MFPFSSHPLSKRANMLYLLLLLSFLTFCNLCQCRGHKDAKGRRPENPDYDPRTLFLPSHFLKSLTGGQVLSHMNCKPYFLLCNLYVMLTVSLGKQRQWWEFKAQHMDKVLFFKVNLYFWSGYSGTSMMPILLTNYSMNL